MPKRANSKTAAPPLTERLLAWYDGCRRVLPWRAAAGTRPDPYHVVVSEFMLQQTTAATVAGRFGPFLARFPTLDALARAEEADVLHAWQGLGYYRRARALHRCARAVAARHHGRVPRDAARLRELPGIGPYTASAIRAIAFDLPDLPVDGNVLRVMARVHGVEAPLPGAARALAGLAATLTPKERAGDVAQALMDLGATVCRPRRPQCPVCPWHDVCIARRRGDAERLPRRAPRTIRPLRRALVFVLVRGDGALLFRRRPDDGLLGGLHELPSSPWQTGELDPRAALGHAPQDAPWQVRPETVRHGFTHFRLELRLAQARTAAPPPGVWCRPDERHRLALPTVMRKVLDVIGDPLDSDLAARLPAKDLEART